MVRAEELARLAREVITSYESRITSVEQIIGAAHEMLEAFRCQREAIRDQLRETLSRAASLRRRDFDTMMQGMLLRHEAGERAVKEAIRCYLIEQRALTAALKDALNGGGPDQIGAIKALMETIAARQLGREREVQTLLAGFRSDHEGMVQALGALLSNGGSVRVREFKTILVAIQSRHWAYRAQGVDLSAMRGVRTTCPDHAGL